MITIMNGDICTLKFKKNFLSDFQALCKITSDPIIGVVMTTVNSPLLGKAIQYLTSTFAKIVLICPL